METAYTIYHRNGGNMLDLTPKGEKSILFETLLNHFGNDREAAIIAKSNVYSDEFFNWFGDWTAEEKDNVSKVVDENGEPLVAWHGTEDKFEIFDKSKIGSKRPSFYGKGFYFTSDKEYSDLFGDTKIPVYINSKKPYHSTNDAES